MRYMIDTNTCIYVINRRPPKVFDRLKEHRVGEIGISSIVLSELKYGAEKSSDPERNLASLNDFITPLEVTEYGQEQAEAYGRIRSYLERRGEPIGSMDTLIAAHAVSLGLTLITNNTREFSRVPGLTIESWI